MNTITRRVLIAAAAVALAAGFAAGPAGAGTVSRALAVTPATASPGESIVVSGPADCIQESTLTVAIDGLGLSDQVSGDAPWELDFVVPDDAVPGPYAVEVVDGNECSFTAATLTVVAAATTTTTMATTTTAAPAAQAAVAAQPTFTG
jgi:hypothetical protein